MEIVQPKMFIFCYDDSHSIFLAVLLPLVSVGPGSENLNHASILGLFEHIYVRKFQ
ncbi:hypothetical protein SDC9_166570 [bioreactor metagenome]|uniref:Uncharacterized protein n=1 Tax=bioreactor metagenome TaxID=1076179 RepID=A0A645G4Y6_9ZZZZ